jgi:hypothetical protein
MGSIFLKHRCEGTYLHDGDHVQGDATFYTSLIDFIFIKRLPGSLARKGRSYSEKELKGAVQLSVITRARGTFSSRSSISIQKQLRTMAPAETPSPRAQNTSLGREKTPEVA